MNDHHQQSVTAVLPSNILHSSLLVMRPTSQDLISSYKNVGDQQPSSESILLSLSAKKGERVDYCEIILRTENLNKKIDESLKICTKFKQPL